MICKNKYGNGADYECECHAKMGNDFWFLPPDKCLIDVAPCATATNHKPLVIIESPFAGDVEDNIAYARKCVADSVHRGEAPIASHLLFTQPGILNDDIPGERALGIEAGLAWYRVADKCVIYMDRGSSRGMLQGQARAKEHGVPVEVRYIEGDA